MADANTERLHQYWVHGEGAAKIRWGEPGDFDRCVRHLGKYIRNPQGYCDLAHHAALGIWPATHAKLLHGRSAPPSLPVLDVPGQGLRFNPFHAPPGSPGGGRFTSAGGAGGGGKPASAPAGHKAAAGGRGPQHGPRAPRPPVHVSPAHLLAQAKADREKADELEKQLRELEKQAKANAGGAAAAGGKAAHITTHKKTAGTHKHTGSHHHTKHHQSLKDRIHALREQIHALREQAAALEAQAKGHRAATYVTPVTFATLGLPLTIRNAEGSSGMALDTRAAMSAAGQNDLPDDAFAYIEPGGSKDAGGKTVPRSLRHFPIHDEAHVRDALGRAPQSPFGDKAMPKIRAAAQRMGIHMSGDDSGRGFEDVIRPERRYTPGMVELRDDEGGYGQRIAGYGAVFGKLSRNLGGFVENVETSAFNKARADGWPGTVARYNHDANMLLGTIAGRTLTLQTDGAGLYYDVLPPQSRGDILELVGRGDVQHSSFAFRVPPGGDEWTVTDQNYPLRSLREVQLVDVAPVVDPAYPDATAALRSLAEHVDAPLAEVRSMAAGDELRRFFIRTDTASTANRRRKTMFGPAALAAALERMQEPVR